MKKIIIILIAIVSLYYITSCSKSNKEIVSSQNFEKNNVAGISLRTVNLKENNFKFKPTVAGKNSARSLTKLESFGYTYFDVEQNDFNSFFQSVISSLINNQNLVKTNPIDIIVYSKKPKETMSVDDIVAFNVLYGREDNSTFEHQFYKRVENSIQIIPSLSVEAPVIQLRDIASISLHLNSVYGQINCIHLAKFVENQAALLYDNITNDGVLSKELAELDFPIINDAFEMASCKVNYCPKGKDECVKNPRGFKCGTQNPGTCTQLTIDDGSGDDYSRKQNRQAFAYDFRDNFLKTTEFGRKYVEYYYRLSDFNRCYKVINADNLVTFFNFMLKVHSVASTLKNGDNNDIIITQQFIDDANYFITLYKDKTNNSDYKGILDDILNDLNHFKGKTRSEILAEIN